MSQTDMDVASGGSGATVRANVNAHLDALVTNSTGATAPSTTFANMWWYDTTAGVLKKRNNANTAWVVFSPAAKEFFAPVNAGTNAPALNVDHTTVIVDLINTTAGIEFHVPADFTAIVDAVIILFPFQTVSTANWDITSDYGAAGQAKATHSESDTASTYNVTLNQLFELDISGILTSLAAGDYVGIKLTSGDSAHDCSVLGIRFKYS